MSGNESLSIGDPPEVADPRFAVFQATLLEEMRESVIFLDAEGRILSWNRAATRLIGSTKQLIPGNLFRPQALFVTAFPPQEGTTDCPCQRAIGTNRSTAQTYRWCNDQGDEILVGLIVDPVIIPHGEPTAVQGAVVRIHEIDPPVTQGDPPDRLHDPSLWYGPPQACGDQPTPLSGGDLADQTDPTLHDATFSAGGKRLLFAADFISINPVHMVGEKLVGYIRESGAQLLECRSDSVSLLVSVVEPNSASRSTTFPVQIEMHEAGRNPLGNPRTRIRLVIHPPRRKMMGQHDENLHGQVVRELQQYLMIQDHDTSTNIFVGKMKII